MCIFNTNNYLPNKPWLYKCIFRNLEASLGAGLVNGSEGILPSAWPHLLLFGITWRALRIPVPSPTPDQLDQNLQQYGKSSSGNCSMHVTKANNHYSGNFCCI